MSTLCNLTCTVNVIPTGYFSLDKFKYPTIKSYIENKNLPEVEEERRLVFVAITRAKENLKIYFSRGNSLSEEIKKCIDILIA